MAVAVWLVLCPSCNYTDPTPGALDTISLELAGTRLVVEVADEHEERQQGLMYRKELPENHGMLFVFQEEGPVSFWMRNTLIPLSIAYLAPDGVILEIHDLNPLDETPVASHSERVLYALEVNRGWFARHGVKTGDRLALGALPPAAK